MSSDMSKELAKRYGFVDTLYARAHSHLCMMCDLFFQSVKYIFFPGNWDLEVESGRAPRLSEKLLAARDGGSKRIYPHWQSLKSLNEAIESGCHVCRLFMSQLTKPERDHLSNLDQESPLVFAISLNLKVIFYDPSAPLRYKVSLLCAPRSVPSGGSPRKVHTLFHELLMLPTHEKICVSETWLERDRWSSAVQTGLTWINDCVINHVACEDGALKPSSWPSRLIAIGDDDDEVRLCENLDHAPRYFTLSHCWGPEEIPFKLTSKNRSSLHNQLPVEKLSRTFRDAIRFTRELRTTGVSYLWIDALCIIQDSDDDWNNEAAIMGDIYGNGVCNLAACAGSDGTVGLVATNDTWFSHRCIITGGPASCLEGSFTIHNPDTICDSDRGIVTRDESITTRAWCVQELKLSKRVLYFARHQVMWDCSTLTAREQEPQVSLDSEIYAFPSAKREYELQLRFHKDHERWVEGGVDPSVHMIYHQWKTTLSKYTLCNLTRHTDKLVAISGLAKKMHSGLGPDEDYIGGLWTRYLYLHLLWGVVAKRTDFRWREYRAPSWSWASAEGGVDNHRIFNGPFFNCTSLIRAGTDCQTKTANLYGALISGILHVEGPVIKVKLNSRGVSAQAAHVVKSATFGAELELRIGNPKFKINLDFLFPGSDPVNGHCLLVVQDDLIGFPHLAGLILMRQDGTRGRYIRVGLAFALPIGVLQEARSQRLVDANDYESVLPNGDYKITIV